MHAHTTRLKQSTINVQPGMGALIPSSLLLYFMLILFHGYTRQKYEE